MWLWKQDQMTAIELGDKHIPNSFVSSYLLNSQSKRYCQVLVILMHGSSEHVSSSADDLINVFTNSQHTFRASTSTLQKSGIGEDNQLM
jgi:hypothetical protein